MSSNLNLNLKRTSRNPSSIANDEHNDASGANRSGNGDIAAWEQIIADATASAGVDVTQRGTVRVSNLAAAWAFVSITDHDAVPGTVDASTGLAIAPNTTVQLFTGVASSANKSLKLRASAATVQVVIMKP
jgi:hypothetical protein